MLSFLSRHREPLLVGALIIVPLINFLARGGRGREPNVLDRAVLSVSAPLQSGLTWVVDGVGASVSAYVALRGAREAAGQCRVQLAEAQRELNALTEARAENERLKAALGYVEQSGGLVVPARIIGLNATPQFQSFRIDRGEDDGVRVGMPVVTAQGVVGQVVRAVGGAADVMVMTDPQSRIGALVQRTRVRGTVVGAGDGQRMQLDFVRREDDIREGDVVVTAGTDGLFPRGLVLGTVQQVTRPTVGLFLLGALEPAVDFGTVEEVLVLPLTGLSAMRTPEGIR
ncbi:MAG: rod shape-determining protein MreC [Myxococcaceae bacterium]|nr:rod shape-determining protein MreC [Myxococcaceae bacterium]MCA3014835.1 rod shape-determining protein MreC [Myxococcaceae bacterium]